MSVLSYLSELVECFLIKSTDRQIKIIFYYLCFSNYYANIYIFNILIAKFKYLVCSSDSIVLQLVKTQALTRLVNNTICGQLPLLKLSKTIPINFY